MRQNAGFAVVREEYRITLYPCRGLDNDRQAVGEIGAVAGNKGFQVDGKV
jgi:hypothetical protein